MLWECRSSLSYVTVRGTRGGAHRPCSFCSCNAVSPGMESRPERRTSCVISRNLSLFSLVSCLRLFQRRSALLFAQPRTTTIPSRRKTTIVLSPLNRILTAYLILNAIVRCNLEISLVWDLKKKIEYKVYHIFGISRGKYNFDRSQYNMEFLWFND